LVAEELEPVKAALFEMLGVDDAYVDPKIIKFGLKNIVLTLGDTFLEVVCPVDEGTTAGRLRTPGRYRYPHSLGSGHRSCPRDTPAS
jgi:hypothetical protein